jgi:glycosyltransferase involved in cell wall biosynthesis
MDRSYAVNIAVLTSEVPFPPSKSGGANTIYHLFKEYKKLEDQVDLLVLTPADGIKAEFPAELSASFHRVRALEYPDKSSASIWFRSLLTLHTIQSQRLLDNGFTDVLESYDMVFIHDFPLISYCSLIRSPKVFFICDSPVKYINSLIAIEPHWMGKAKLRLKKIIYKNMLKSHLNDVGKMLYISEVDKDYDQLLLHRQADASFINNGVDYDYYVPDPQAEKKYDLAFLGNFSYEPNRQALSNLVRHIIPKLQETKPDLSCVVVGKNAPEELTKTGRGIHFTGFVEDVRPYLRAAKLFVSPLYSGAGMKNKILETMALNMPIVATDISYEGIHINDNYMFRANNDLEFITIIQRELQRYDQIQGQINNRDFVYRYYSWASQAKKLHAIFHSNQQG